VTAKASGIVSGALVVAATTSLAVGAGQAVREIVFVGARLVDVEAGRLVDDATIVVRDGRVETIGPAGTVSLPDGARAVDLRGRFVLPGLVSAHVHVSDVHGDRPRAHTDGNTARQLGVFARYGITTVLSLDGEGDPGFKARGGQATPALDRARLFLSGDAVAASTPDEARRLVAAVAARRPDFVKIRVDDNLGTAKKMSPDVYRAVIDEAHGRGLRVAAHIFYLEDAKDLLRAGVDVIAHSVRDQDIDEEFIALMKARDVPYCPTLTRELSTFVYESTPSFFSDPFFLREADPAVVARLQTPARQQAMAASRSAQAYKAGLVVATRNLKRAADAGLRVVVGTDAGPLPERFQGFFEHLEMEMMVDAGLTTAQVLRAATIDGARVLRLDEVGRLAPGTWADMIVLERNPLDDIRHTRSIASVYVAGNEVPR
jgi:imidazolonepropionase-like amidohydrolase